MDFRYKDGKKTIIEVDFASPMHCDVIEKAWEILIKPRIEKIRREAKERERMELVRNFDELPLVSA